MKAFRITALASAVILAGCASAPAVNKQEKSAATNVLERYEVSTSPGLRPSFIVTDGFYAARTPISDSSLSMSARFPPVFSRPANTTIQSTTSLSEMASRITSMSGYPVVVEADVLAGNGPAPLQDLAFKGNLISLLDHLTAKAGVSWRWTGSKIQIFRYDTRMFQLKALAGSTQVSNELTTKSSSSGGTSGSSSTGETGQSTKIESTFDVWKDIEGSLKSTLSSNGTMSLSTSSGTITVRDTPSVLAQVEAQVRELNKIYSRQVVINVEVYAVERKAVDALGTDWSAIWTQAAAKYGIDFSTIGLGTSNNSPVPTFNFGVNTGEFAGSQFIFQTLSTLGNATLLTNSTLSILNGQSAPLNVSREQSYLQSYSTTLSGNSSSQSTTTLTPGVVTEGFSMNFTPRVLDDNRVLIRYSIDLASTDAIETFESPDGNSAIQLPRRSVRNFLQNVNGKSGETVVMTGFQQSLTASQKSGPVTPEAWFAGGKRNSESLVRTIVVVVTPHVVEY